jgi:ABC-type nickel/cobalt efflux system permease component RcnA
MMFGVLILGLLVGLQHATEADHVAAVASLTTRSRSLREAARLGTAWGIGHTLTLLVFAGGVLLIGAAIPAEVALWLETVVAVMLIGLGADVLRRLWRQRIHFHSHQHGSKAHFHAHSHDARTEHAADPHKHSHRRQLPLRSLLVGMMHGMAGSAALIVFALGAVQSPWQGLLYILLFGIGSIIGMILLAVVISLPLRWSAKSLTWAHNGLTAVFGIATIAIGGFLLHGTTAELLGSAVF